MPENKPQDIKLDKVSLNDVWKITRWVFSLLFKLEPKFTVLYLIGATLSRLQEIGYTYIFARIIDQLISVAQNPGTSISVLYPYIALLIGYNVLETGLSYIESSGSQNLRNYSRPKIRQAFYEKLNSLGIQTLEQPSVNDRIHRAENYLQSVLPYIDQSIALIANIIRLITVSLIVMSSMPLIGLFVAVVCIPYLIMDKKYRKQIYEFDFNTTEDQRRAGASYGQLTNAYQLLEISITNAYNFLDRKYMNFNTWATNVRMKIFKNWRISSHSLGLLADTVVVTAYLDIFRRLISGAISVGTLTFLMRSI